MGSSFPLTFIFFGGVAKNHKPAKGDLFVVGWNFMAEYVSTFGQDPKNHRFWSFFAPPYDFWLSKY